MKKKVDFFIVGAPKCGTTALVDYLNQLDNVFVPEVKEPHFHCVDWPEFRRIKTEREYAKIYESARNEVCGDASVWYLFSKEACKEIRRHNSQAKIIIMIRKPYDAAVSLHSQLIFSGREDELDFVKAWDLQPLRAAGERLPRNAIVGEHLQYKKVYDYPDQIKRYQELFDEDQIKVIVFEDFVSNTDKTFKEVCAFLGVDIKNKILYEKVNSNRYHKYPALAHFIMRPPAPFSWIKEGVKRYLFGNKPILRPLYKMFSVKRSRPMIAEEERQRISRDFADVEERTRKMVEKLPW
ncbi:sulfotransferase family protein [Alcanivoracaceae bacterium MT1]